MSVLFRLPEISPQDMDIKELFAWLLDYKDALNGMVSQLFPNLDPDSLLLSLIKIRGNSIEAVFTSNYSNEIQQASQEMHKDIENKDFTRTPVSTRMALSRLIKKAEEKNCTVEIYPDSTNRKVKAKISPEDTALLSPEVSKIQGTSVLFGEVITVGGAEPGSKLRLSDGTLFSVKLTRELAKNLGDRLYEDVSLRGVATWDSNTLTLLNFRAEEIMPYKKTPMRDAVKAIHEADPDAWADVDDVDGTIKGLR